MNFDEVLNRRASESYKWREYPADVLPLFVADMDFRSPDCVADALRAYVNQGVFGYPRGLHSYDRAQVLELPALLVERMARRYGWHVDVEDIVLVPGVVPGLNIACHALAKSDEAASVLVQPPVYPPILGAPVNAHLRRREAPLTCEADGSYTIDWDRFVSAISPDTRLFTLCNPHNPVGRVFRRSELEKVAEICVARDITICSDEIHSDLLFDHHEHIPIASLGPEVARLTITLVAPSKTFNLAGLQCGFAIIPDADLRRRYRAAREGLVPWVNGMALIGAEAAYRHGQPWLDELLRYLDGNRTYLQNFLRRELPQITMAPLEGTYLAWLDCRKLEVGNAYEFFLQQARVALNDGGTFGNGGDGFVRLNIGCPRSTLEEALKRIRDSLK